MPTARAVRRQRNDTAHSACGIERFCSGDPSQGAASLAWAGAYVDRLGWVGSIPRQRLPQRTIREVGGLHGLLRRTSSQRVQQAGKRRSPRRGDRGASSGCVMHSVLAHRDDKRHRVSRNAHIYCRRKFGWVRCPYGFQITVRWRQIAISDPEERRMDSPARYPNADPRLCGRTPRRQGGHVRSK